MDTRTIGQILSNPDWLRSTLAEERPIQQAQMRTDIPAPTQQQDYPGYQPVALPPHPGTFIPAPAPGVPVRPDSSIVEVRGTIAYVARYRAEYFNPNDQPQMMALAQSVIMGEAGEDPPPWFPDVQFWIQSFERIDPYANAQAEELERLALHRAKIEAEQLARIREAEVAEQLRRERALYGEPGTFSREGTLTGLAPGGPPRDERGPDWLGGILRDITSAIGGIHERLEAMERRDGGAGGAGAAVPTDQHLGGDADARPGDGGDRPDDRRDSGDGGDAAVHAAPESRGVEPNADHPVRADPETPGRADGDTGAGYVAGRTERRKIAKGT